MTKQANTTDRLPTAAEAWTPDFIERAAALLAALEALNVGATAVVTRTVAEDRIALARELINRFKRGGRAAADRHVAKLAAEYGDALTPSGDDTPPAAPARKRATRKRTRKAATWTADDAGAWTHESGATLAFAPYAGHPFKWLGRWLVHAADGTYLGWRPVKRKKVAGRFYGVDVYATDQVPPVPKAWASKLIAEGKPARRTCVIGVVVGEAAATDDDAQREAA
jgi:hypothetical protein